MKNFTLKLQIWLGFGLILGLIAVIAVTSIYYFKQVDYIVSEAQPSTLDTLIITADLNDTARAINAYMVSHKNSEKKALKVSLATLNLHLKNFSSLDMVSEDKALSIKVTIIQKLISKFNEYIVKIEQIISNPLENYPAIALGNSELNPLSKSILTSFDQAIRSEEEEDNTQERKELLIAFSDLRHNWMNIISSNRAFLANPGDKTEAQIQLYKKLHLSLIDSLQESSDLYSFEQEEAVEIIVDQTAKHFKLLDDVYEIFTSGKWRADQLLLTNEIQPLAKRISGVLAVITDEQQENTRAISNDLLTKIDTAIWVTKISLFAALIIGLGVAWSNARQINGLVTEVSDSLKKMSNGDFEINLNEKKAGEAGQLAVVINGFSRRLSDMIENLTNSVYQLESASHTMSTVITESSENIMQQHKGTEVVAESMKEMMTTVRTVANSTAIAVDSVKLANELTATGSAASVDARGGINKLTNDISDASEVIKNLKHESNNISDILNVINDIAEQTNLLALNAAIEAARAGDHGRGFAVVADEVRILANRTQESTHEIRQNIDRLQNGANDAVNAMENAIDKVTVSNSQVEQTAETLDEIVTQITSINGELIQMGVASEQQDVTSNKINHNIVSITELANKTAKSTEQAKMAESELAQVTQSIHEVIGKFKLHEEKRKHRRLG